MKQNVFHFYKNVEFFSDLVRNVWDSVSEELLVLLPVLEHDVHGRQDALVALEAADAVGIGDAVAHLARRRLGPGGDLDGEDGGRLLGLGGLELVEREDRSAALGRQGREEVLRILELLSEDVVALEVVQVLDGEDGGLAEAVDLVGGLGLASAPAQRGSGRQVVESDGLKHSWKVLSPQIIRLSSSCLTLRDPNSRSKLAVCKVRCQSFISS